MSSGYYILDELLCLKCNKRYAGVHNIDSKLTELMCPGCGTIGHVISTGHKFKLKKLDAKTEVPKYAN